MNAPGGHWWPWPSMVNGIRSGNAFVPPMLMLLVALFFECANAQMDCSKAPNPDVRTLCEQLHKWDKNARVKPRIFLIITIIYKINDEIRRLHR